MLNQVVLVGRVQEIIPMDNSIDLHLRVPRSFKNENGEYDNDIIKIKVMGAIASNMKDYVRIGDCVGVKGRLANKNGGEELNIVAEKVTFLSTHKNDEGEK